MNSQKILCLALSAGLLAALTAYGTAQEEPSDMGEEEVQEEVQEEAPAPVPEPARPAQSDFKSRVVQVAPPAAGPQAVQTAPASAGNEAAQGGVSDTDKYQDPGTGPGGQPVGGMGLHAGNKFVAPPKNPKANKDESVCSGPPLPTGRFVVSNRNGWWPKVSQDGEWVSFGARTVAMVNVRTHEERKLPVEDCTYSAGWMRPNVLRAINKCDGRSFDLTAPGFAPLQTRDNAGLAIGHFVVAADGHWASDYGGRIAYDNKSLATGAGNAIDVSGNWLVYAKTNAHKEISVWKGGNHAADYSVKIPMFELAVTGGYIVYGYGGIRGITPAGTDISLTAAPPGLLEGLAKVFFVGTGTAARPWIASRI